MIKAMTPRQEAPEDIEVITAEDGTTVITGDITFPNLAAAVSELIKTLRSDENNKVRAARIVDAIDRQELYKEAGMESFKAFFPMLLEQTQAVGWKSATSIKRYLGWYRLYLRALQLEPNAAIGAVSHLHTLYKLAHIDRKTGDLTDPDDSAGKLNPVAFEDIVRLITTLVGGFSDTVLTEVLGAQTIEDLRIAAALPEGMAAGAVVVRTGLTPEQTSDVLTDMGMSTQAATYAELMGEPVVLPARGWTLAQTEAVIAKVQGEAEDESDETVKVQKVWIGYSTFEGSVYIERIEFLKGETKLDELSVEKQYATAHFELIRGGDAAEIAGQDGEQAGE